MKPRPMGCSVCKGPMAFSLRSSAIAPKEVTPAGAYSGETTVDDAVFDAVGTSAPIYGTQYQIDVDVLSQPPAGAPAVTLASSNAARATISGKNTVYQGSGAFSVIGTSGNATASVALTNSTTQDPPTITNTTFNRWASASLAYHCRQSVRSYMTGHTPPSCLEHFTCIDNDTGEYQHNAASWLYALRQPLTCMSPWNSRLKNLGAGVLVTRKHAITCLHMGGYQAGDLFHFIAADNSIVTATVASYQQVGSTDIGLLTFTKDVDESISIADILPDDYADYLPTLATGTAAYRYLECLRTNQHKQITMAMLSGVSGADQWTIAESTVADEAAFIDAVEENDSGSPRFLIVNGGLVLLFALHEYPDKGPSPTVNRAAIETLTGEGYTLSQVDLSAFENYGG